MEPVLEPIQRICDGKLCSDPDDSDIMYQFECLTFPDPNKVCRFLLKKKGVK